MKATQGFSYGGKHYDVGDNIVGLTDKQMAELVKAGVVDKKPEPEPEAHEGEEVTNA